MSWKFTLPPHPSRTLATVQAERARLLADIAAHEETPTVWGNGQVAGQIVQTSIGPKVIPQGPPLAAGRRKAGGGL
jgi:hypothetical protein